MAGSLPTIIVWEFQSDLPGMFTPYSDKVSNHIEDQYTVDPTAKITLAQVDPVLKDFSVELDKMIQLSSRSGSKRQVRRQLYDSNTSIANGIVWEWLTDIGWITYDVETLNAIESAFTRNEDELDLAQLPFQLPNVVLIQKGYQKNKNTNFVRPIQRKAVTYKSSSSVQPVPVRKRANQFPTSANVPVSYNTPTVNPLPNIRTNNRFGGALSAGSNPLRKHANKKQSKPAIPRKPGAVGGPVAPVLPAKAAPQKKLEVMKYCNIITQIPDGEDCAICLIPLKDSDSDSDDDDDDNGQNKKLMDIDPVVQLNKCKHCYHQSCMEAYCKQGLQNGCIQCPICKTIHGVKIGNQPPGTMDASVDKNTSVSGYEGDGMITITYNIHSGMQGPNHPNPGTRYTATGFPRVAYLPANAAGRKVLKLLELAWERKLIFCIDTSTTTGRENCVVWNEIHHKTSPRDNMSGHGYPDPKYMDNVIEELKQHGVIENDIS